MLPDRAGYARNLRKARLQMTLDMYVPPPARRNAASHHDGAFANWRF